MSLNRAQREQTARELRANLQKSGLDTAEICRQTGWSAARVESTLAIDEADPVDVWRLRDLLERAAEEAGNTPTPFSVLTESARAAARGWFGNLEGGPSPIN